MFYVRAIGIELSILPEHYTYTAVLTKSIIAKRRKQKIPYTHIHSHASDSAASML